MKRSRHRIGLLVGVLTLAAVVVACVSVVPAGAVDVKPRRVIRDRDPNFSTLSVDSVNNEILVGNDAQESLQVYSRTAHGLVAPLREIKSPPATDTTSPHNTFVTFPGQVIIDPLHNEIWSVGNDIADAQPHQHLRAHDEHRHGSRRHDEADDQRQLDRARRSARRLHRHLRQ